MEIISILRIYTMFHLCISIHMRWLAGNTHTLHTSDWSIYSIGKVINLLEGTLITISNNGSIMLSDEFIMSIFLPLKDTLLDFEEFIDFYIETQGNSHNDKE